MADASAAEGTLELDDKGFGFLRSAGRNYSIHPTDPYVGPEVIKRFALRGGEAIGGAVQRSNGKQQRGPRSQFMLTGVETINGLSPGQFAELKPFTELTAVDPKERIQFETPGGSPSMRVVDLMTPIGRGQRGLIAAPPRTGKTVLLQQMAAGIATNHPDLYMMVLLIDERPEEVTEVMILNDFCSVNQDGSRNWDELIPEVDAILIEHFRK